jgi:5-(carboxyamino)imidazole ribonucleotide mutase
VTSSRKKAAQKQKKVAIVMGSESDLPFMKQAAEALDHFGVFYQMEILSAHRTPHEVAKFGEEASAQGFLTIIAGAGGAAHLPGMIASYTELPVIGVPIPIGPLQGQDALLSIVQMPTGVPVATVAIGNAWNAGVLAVQILAIGQTDDPELTRQLKKYKQSLREKVLKQKKL